MNADFINLNAPSFMAMLPERVAAEVRHAANLVRYADGQMIHSRGDEKPGISIVKSGAAYAGAFGEDGSFVMTSILGPGQTFGEFTLFANLPRTHDIAAIGKTEIYQISGPRFLKLYETEPEISKALLSSSLTRTHLLLEMMDAMRRLPLPERTGKILLIMIQLSDSHDVFECRQSDLAFALGVSRMSMSKALKQLEAQALIERGYGKIRIRDLKKLQTWVSLFG